MAEPPDPEAPTPPPWARRPILLAAVLVAAIGVTPYAAATVAPPPERAFTGFFWFDDDQYNYLSFAQQAEDGAFLFRNKLVLEAHPPALANVEWWVVGRLSR